METIRIDGRCQSRTDYITTTARVKRSGIIIFLQSFHLLASYNLLVFVNNPVFDPLSPP